ncbi:MAG: Hsp70 family protein, partial [Ruminococcus sp.]|nr:Hsp70 family protein [Ruminococcus sp.]
EQYAAEDKKRREQVDNKNEAENLVFQCEKALADFGDKVSADEKANIEAKSAALKSAIEAENHDEIKTLKDELQKEFYDLSAKIYQQANPNGAGGIDPSQFANMGGAAQADDTNAGGDDVVDADFTEV